MGCDVCFGPLAALYRYSSSTAAFGGKAVVQKTSYQNPKLNVCFHQKRTVNFVFLIRFQRPLWRKADIKPEAPEIETENVRFTPESSR